jgi:hypothetical protein
MDLTAVVLFKGALAHYTVTLKSDGTYVADLLKYCGHKPDEPPATISFKKLGRHCDGNTEEQELMDDIYDAVQSKLSKGGIQWVRNNPNSPSAMIW